MPSFPLSSTLQERALRVAVLTTSFPLTTTAVSGTFVKRLIQNLPPSVEATAIAPSGIESEQLPTNANYQIRCFRYAPRSWQQLAHQPGGIPATLKQRRIFYLLLPVFLGSMFLACLRTARNVDLIHANWSINGVIAGIAAWFTGKPIITTLRGQDVNRSRSSRVYRIILGLCLRLSNHVVAVSDSIRFLAVQQFPTQNNKFTVIHNGVDQCFLDIGARRQQTDSQTLRLITVASLIPLKGVEQIIQAVNLLKNEIDLNLTIVGNGPEKEKLQNLTKLFELHKKISFTGNIAPSEIPAYLEKADIFILASHSEGRPNVLLEAMAAGLPIIATNIPGTQEIVQNGKTGILFPPKSIERLADALRRLSQNASLRQQLAKNARRFILDQGLFWTHTSSRYAELYRQILS
ncbi:glycosyltransferase family 4 protein [Nitrosococcus watsonii]|uniref:Glycosyl transferase group 1 n=1 Tax=Nitrosococcus watsoni (strain C-113) TaxID=105559 RepID=D8K9W2_NITWC|nr:glycosyltransferase family 4 protein [Nitrosococcus watsonii]ADJ29320.1 glycosyl transferase group 1 [Nitrosococcus watsonii C-113]